MKTLLVLTRGSSDSNISIYVLNAEAGEEGGNV